MTRFPASEPILILSDAEYRRAFQPRAPKVGRTVAGALCLVAALAGAVAWWARETPRSVAIPVAAPRPRAVPPQPSREPVPDPPVRSVAVVSAPPEEEEPPAAAEPAPPPPKAPWCGGGVWVRLKLRMEHRARIQECERRVVVVEESSRYLVERSGDGSRDLWLDRLELLLTPPAEEESRRRQVTRTGSDTLHLRNGDLVCRMVEGQDRFPQGDRRFRYWYSDQFPLGPVQAEETLGDLVFACRVLDFGPADSRRP